MTNLLEIPQTNSNKLALDSYDSILKFLIDEYTKPILKLQME